MGKIIETLIANRIRDVAKENRLLLDEQIGGRKGRLTKTALDLLTRQIRTI